MPRAAAALQRQSTFPVRQLIEPAPAMAARVSVARLTILKVSLPHIIIHFSMLR